MARQKQVSHAGCDHENTAAARQVCRDQTRHMECAHPKTEWFGKMCDRGRLEETTWAKRLAVAKGKGGAGK